MRILLLIGGLWLLFWLGRRILRIPQSASPAPNLDAIILVGRRAIAKTAYRHLPATAVKQKAKDPIRSAEPRPGT